MPADGDGASLSRQSEYSACSGYWNQTFSQDWSQQGVGQGIVLVQRNVGSLLKCRVPGPQNQDILQVMLIQMVL